MPARDLARSLDIIAGGRQISPMRVASPFGAQLVPALKPSNEVEPPQTQTRFALDRAMTPSNEEIRHRLHLGEDSRWEFKQIAFVGDRPASPRREDLADEMAAFANAIGGALLCGVTDDGQVQGMSLSQMAALDRLLVEVATDSVEPPLRIEVHHRELEGRAFLLVQVPRGEAVHSRSGQAFVRVGATRRRLQGDERLRLAQSRAQSRYLWFDKQVVPGTGFETLSERLWEPLLSAAAAEDPRQGLMNLRLLAKDEADVDRATVAGILLCAPEPQAWLPQATIAATHYRGRDRASGQLDAQEIAGPLPAQIADAVKFVVRNMRVAARKLPEREDVPQYGIAAVFEAVVNAVVHRDYSMSSRRIRLSMFGNRLEIDSPGQLPNGMTIEAMEASQATRNEALASIFGRLKTGHIRGGEDRPTFMEHRGDGVRILMRETRELCGKDPEYRQIGDRDLCLIVPAASHENNPESVTVKVLAEGRPLPGAELLALFPNHTWKETRSGYDGEGRVTLYTTQLPMKAYVAAPGHAAHCETGWVPDEGPLNVNLDVLRDGGAVIFPEGTGNIPGLAGRLEPTGDRINEPMPESRQD